MSDDNKFYVVAAIMLLAWLVGWVAVSHQEARAFERVTGKQVSTWDAMFINLRIQEGADE